MLLKRSLTVMVMVLLIFATPFRCMATDTPASGPQAFLPASTYEFAPVVEGAAVAHEFILHNRGDAPLKIIEVISD